MSVNSNLSLLHSEESSAPVSIAELDERFSISPQGSDTQPGTTSSYKDARVFVSNLPEDSDMEVIASAPHQISEASSLIASSVHRKRVRSYQRSSSSQHSKRRRSQ